MDDVFPGLYLLRDDAVRRTGISVTGATTTTSNPMGGQAVSSQSVPTPKAGPLSISAALSDEELDRLKFAIKACWSVPAAVRDAKDMRITVGLELDPSGNIIDGTIRLTDPEALPDSRYDAAFRAARIALLRCAPYSDLPPGKYAHWGKLEVSFSNSGPSSLDLDLTRPTLNKNHPEDVISTANIPTLRQSSKGEVDVPQKDLDTAGMVSGDTKSEMRETAGVVGASVIEAVPVSSQETEAALSLGSQAIRDIQARLLVLGHDPNGIDGMVGPGTRNGLRSWQASLGLSESGYLNAEQLSELKEQSRDGLAVWLKNPENARRHTPPPAIALGPKTMSGSWRFVSKCGGKSRSGISQFDGVLQLKHAGGNQYSGTAALTQGIKGRFSGALNGRTLTGEINWGFLIGKDRLQATVAKDKLAMSGRDSDSCNFYAAK